MHINMHCPWCESYTTDVQTMRNHIEGIHQYTMAPYVFRANITRGVNRSWYIEISKLSRDTRARYYMGYAVAYSFQDAIYVANLRVIMSELNRLRGSRVV